LKELVVSRIRGEQGAREMTVLLQSFGYRFGIPLEADLVMDVRFLPNPHFIPELKLFSGLDPKVREFVMEKPETVIFLEKFLDMMTFLLPSYRREGKSYLTISIGCTGGRHRSVVIAEALRDFFAGKNVNLKVTHRDMEKGAS
jgi:RNase adapter protein RapZ